MQRVTTIHSPPQLGVKLAESSSAAYITTNSQVWTDSRRWFVSAWGVLQTSDFTENEVSEQAHWEVIHGCRKSLQLDSNFMWSDISTLWTRFAWSWHSCNRQFAFLKSYWKEQGDCRCSFEQKTRFLQLVIERRKIRLEYGSASYVKWGWVRS